MEREDFRCIHRHTIQEHPNCFFSGKVKYNSSFESEKDFVKKTGLPWYAFPGYRIGYIDIETSGFDADYGTMLCWAILDKYTGEVFYDKITKEDIDKNPASPDNRIVRALVDKMKEYKILVGYYSTRFDLPFIRTRAFANKIKNFPNFGDIYHFDLYYVVRNKFKLSRNSLERVCELLGISGKNHIKMDYWRKAIYGDEKAINYILDHCVRDVRILEQLHDKIIFQTKHTRKSM